MKKPVDLAVHIRYTGLALFLSSQTKTKAKRRVVQPLSGCTACLFLWAHFATRPSFYISSAGTFPAKEKAEPGAHGVQPQLCGGDEGNRTPVRKPLTQAFYERILRFLFTCPVRPQAGLPGREPLGHDRVKGVARFTFTAGVTPSTAPRYSPCGWQLIFKLQQPSRNC